MNILISALTPTHDIIEETIGFFNHAEGDFYAQGAHARQVQEARRHVEAVDELWLVATARTAREDFTAVQSACVPYGAKLRLFLLQGVPDIQSQQDADAFHDMALNVTLAAKRRARGGKLYLSLASGRKTMSAAMQDAAYCFGCDQLLHIVMRNPKDRKEDALPVLLGPVSANPALRAEAPDFPDAEILEWASPAASLLNDIKAQKEQAQHFFTTYYLREEGSRANFHILYTLPPDKIEALKEERIATNPARREEELAWLKRLPKADLHCHLGGVLSPAEMIEVAGCYESQLAEATRVNPKFAAWRKTLRPLTETPSGGWKTWRKDEAKPLGVHESLTAAALLLTYRDRPDELERVLYEKYPNEGAFRGIGLDAYEALGDLQGSALLGNEAALRLTLRLLLCRCWAENLTYLELRCSPLNYASAAFPAEAVVRVILDELDRAADATTSSLLLIATRHGTPEEIERNIANNLRLARNMRGDARFEARFRGFDLAGNEEIRPEKLRPHFLPIMADCRNITIHAGETEEAESIWQAVYHLNAERIGHGLTLHEHPELMDKFLERGIGIEMCPSSNFQIVGFRDNFLPETANLPAYPLKRYLDKELKVSVNTDDPGISRTDVTRELHRAARLTPGGLSKWEILQLICNGFRTAFAPYQEKKQLIRRVEKGLGALIQRNEL